MNFISPLLNLYRSKNDALLSCRIGDLSRNIYFGILFWFGFVSGIGKKLPPDVITGMSQIEMTCRTEKKIAYCLLTVIHRRNGA